MYMRFVLLLMVFIASAGVKAQIALPLTYSDYAYRQAPLHAIRMQDSTRAKKWFLDTYGSISTTFSFYNGGSATTVAAPLGLQLSRRLNDNLYAFAGVSVAPAYTNFNRTFLAGGGNKTYPANPMLQSGGFNMYSRAELGLMYINDQKTFSISGSISVERSSYPVVPYYPATTTRQNPVISPN